MVKMSYLAWDIQRSKGTMHVTHGAREDKNIFFFFFCPQHSKAIHSQVAIEKEIEHAHIDVEPIVSTMDFQRRQRPISFCNI
jgi:hypothetical protein